MLLVGGAADRFVTRSGLRDLETKVSKRAQRNFDKYSAIISGKSDEKGMFN